MNKNFARMKQYLTKSFQSQQRKLFQKNFGGDNFDIIYNPELLELIPISYKHEEDKHFLKVQINAKMVNFILSPKGYILSGESSARSFTEYWTFEIDLKKKLVFKRY
ncbi:MAG: hypothetical protein ACRC11_05620 [Xenococcaceae cyanobacterium]